MAIKISELHLQSQNTALISKSTHSNTNSYICFGFWSLTASYVEVVPLQHILQWQLYCMPKCWKSFNQTQNVKAKRHSLESWMWTPLLISKFQLHNLLHSKCRIQFPYLRCISGRPLSRDQLHPYLAWESIQYWRKIIVQCFSSTMTHFFKLQRLDRDVT